MIGRIYPICGALIMASASLAFAANSNFPAQQSPASGHATTIPIDGRRITVRLVMPENRDVLVVQRNGGLIRTEFQGQEYGFAPRINDDNQTVTLVVFRIGTGYSGGVPVGETMSQLETMDLDSAIAQSPTTISTPFKLKLERVMPPKSPEDDAATKARARSDTIGELGDCCLTCDGIRACGCSVIGPCGSCCTDCC